MRKTQQIFHIHYIFSLQCVCSQISAEVLGNTLSHISYTCMLSLQCEFSQDFEGITYKFRLSYSPDSNMTSH